MRSAYFILKSKAITLRKSGKTYEEIRRTLGENIPKSTLSLWCSDIPLSLEHQKRIKNVILVNSKKGRKIALIANLGKREKYLQSIVDRNVHLADSLKDKDIAKVALSMLYLGEGSKNAKRGSLMFGNSGPFIVSLFLRLMRYCYNIDENKIRCTLQCRADQNIKGLERFWSEITEIPLKRFYKAKIDPRTIGKSSKKKDYKGVCRIDYFSADILLDLLQ